MQRFYFKSKAKQQGSTTVEFAVVLPLLLFLVISCFDLVRGMLLRVSLDHAIAEASRHVKLTAASGAQFQQALLASIKRKQFVELEPSDLQVTNVSFFATPAAMAANQAASVQGSLIAPLVRYQLSYRFDSLSPWIGQLDFNTQVVVKHEN